MKFGELLRKIRKESKVSQVELSQKTGIPQATISAYESGKHDPPWVSVCLFASALQVSTDAFRCHSGESVEDKPLEVAIPEEHPSEPAKAGRASGGKKP